MGRFERSLAAKGEESQLFSKAILTGAIWTATFRLVTLLRSKTKVKDFQPFCHHQHSHSHSHSPDHDHHHHYLTMPRRLDLQRKNLVLAVWVQFCGTPSAILLLGQWRQVEDWCHSVPSNQFLAASESSSTRQMNNWRCTRSGSNEIWQKKDSWLNRPCVATAAWLVARK